MPRSMVVFCNRLAPPHCYLRFISLQRISLHKKAHFSIYIRGPLSSPNFGFKKVSSILFLRLFSILLNVFLPSFLLMGSPFLGYSAHLAWKQQWLYPCFSSAICGCLMLQNISSLLSLKMLLSPLVLCIFIHLHSL